jgi:hypothetical protein
MSKATTSKTRMISIRFPLELLASVKADAKARGVSVGALIIARTAQADTYRVMMAEQDILLKGQSNILAELAAHIEQQERRNANLADGWAESLRPKDGQR